MSGRRRSGRAARARHAPRRRAARFVAIGAAAERRARAAPVGEHAARLLDDGLQRRRVPRRQRSVAPSPRRARWRRAGSRSSRPTCGDRRRVRQRAAIRRARSGRSRKRSSVVSTVASASVATRRHAGSALPFHQQPAPGAAATSSSTAGKYAAPASTRSPSHSATSEPHSGTPRTNVFVPSIGSMIQRRAAPGRSSPNSSPRMPSCGEAALRSTRAPPAPRRGRRSSPGEPSAFVSTVEPRPVVPQRHRARDARELRRRRDALVERRPSADARRSGRRMLMPRAPEAAPRASRP